MMNRVVTDPIIQGSRPLARQRCSLIEAAKNAINKMNLTRDVFAKLERNLQ